MPPGAAVVSRSDSQLSGFKVDVSISRRDGDFHESISISIWDSHHHDGSPCRLHHHRQRRFRNLHVRPQVRGRHSGIWGRTLKSPVRRRSPNSILLSVSWNRSTFHSVSGDGSTVTVSGPGGASGNFNLDEQTTFQMRETTLMSVLGTNGHATSRCSLPTPLAGSSSPGTESYSYDSTAVLSEFTGTGDFSLQISGSQHADTTFAPPGITAKITDGNFGADACVTYVYTVPEPGCASLLAIGFGLMLVRRKAWKE